MPTITTKDGTEIYYKDWGKGQPIVFSHGWPLSADDWDTQMLFFLAQGYRVIAHDRRGHGRSSQTADGHDMDHYADDLAALTAHLDLKDADPHRPLDRRRRGRALPGAPRREAGGQGGAHQRGAAADGQDDGQPRRASQGGVRRIAGADRGQPGPSSTSTSQPGRSTATTGRARSPPRRHPELVAPGHDGRRQGALRRHRRVLPDGLHRGPEGDHCPGAGDARRRRPDRPVSPTRRRSRPSC